MYLRESASRIRFTAGQSLQVFFIGSSTISASKERFLYAGNRKLNDVVEALESAMEEHSYYLDKRTGEIILLTAEELRAAEEDDLISEYPDWQRDSILKAREVFSDPEAFVQLPDQFDIHEYEIMEDFCLAFEDRRIGQQLLRLIKGSGAFRRFKDAIHEKGVEKVWYEFKRNEFEKIAIEWLEENEIPYSRDEDTVTVSEASM